jgi:hypothetical protein
MKIFIGMELVKSLIFLERLLPGVLVSATTIILMIFFCEANILLLLEEYPPPKIIFVLGDGVQTSFMFA